MAQNSVDHAMVADLLNLAIHARQARTGEDYVTAYAKIKGERLNLYTAWAQGDGMTIEAARAELAATKI